MQKIHKVDPQEVLAIINRLDFFRDFNADEKKQVSRHHSQCCLYREGEHIIREGEDDRAIFVLLSGAANVTKKFHGSVIANLLPGEIFGEISFLTGRKRTTDVVASAEKVIVLRADQAMLQDLNPETREKIKDKIILKLIKRLDFMNKLLY